MNYKRITNLRFPTIMIISLLFFHTDFTAKILSAQSVEAEGIADDDLSTPAEDHYIQKKFYSTYPNLDPQGGFSFFGLGMKYGYNNAIFNLNFLNVGIRRSYHLKSEIRLLLYSLLELSLGYTLRYPLRITRYDLIEHIGTFRLGFYLENTTIRNHFRAGLMSHRYNMARQNQRFAMLQNEFHFNYVLAEFSDAWRLDTNVQFTWDYVIKPRESFYQFYLDFVLKQKHGWGEFAIRPLFIYNGAMGNHAVVKAQQNFLSATTFVMFHDIPFYNIAEAILSEYRFFFMRLGPRSYKWYEDFYFSAT
ncbi:MAG: hypothetical protein AAF975_08605, partial [Spirochaetota bacterium]